MSFVWLLWGLCALALLVLALVAAAAVRAARMKPTGAVKAQFPEADMARAQKYAEGLAGLVRCETVSFRGQTDRRKFAAFHKVLRRTFPKLHRTAEIIELDKSLLYKIAGTAPGHKPPILLMSHQDVVAAEGEWPHEPFSGDIADGAVWGRGTVDTKGSLYCIMQAVEELLATGWKPECDVYIASSCTEEWSGDGAPATAAWLKEHGVHLGLLLDEGGMIMEGPMAGVRGRYGMVGVVEKGYADVKLVAKDDGGHASAPGRNTALVRLAKLMCRVEKRNPFRARFSPTLREMFRRMAPNMKFGMRLVLGNLWLFEPLLCFVLPRVNHLAGAMMRTTCAFTTAKGSDGLNVLPQEAYVTANMRCIPHQPTGESIAILEKLAKKYGVEAQVIYQDAVPPVADYHAAPFKLLEETMAKVYPGYGVCPYIMTGGTDARFYKEVTDNALRFAPLEINHQQHASIHAAAENLSVLALPPAVDFYKQLLESYCTLEEGRRPAAKKPAARRAAKKTAPASAPKAAAPETPAAPAEKAPAKKPAAKKPAAKKPAAKKPAAKKAAPKSAAETPAEPAPAEGTSPAEAPAAQAEAAEPATV
ncbi:M20/M25/M40 family metallo-hydrolase [Candidatus Allofournierella excrementigallinarum]|uniref:M20/M25/M40 family metallo-hydrolase n=1 Tax=Candidatus Allofournierella excrementigallinarum TaxID=2838592 RepID=UPI00374EF23B